MKRSRFSLIVYFLGVLIALTALTNGFYLFSSFADSATVASPPTPSLEATRQVLQPDSRSSLASRQAGKPKSLDAPTLIERVTRASSAGGGLFVPMISATKTFMPAGSAVPGATLTYSVVISNTGPDPALGVNFNDTIDPNTTLVAGSLIVSPIAVNDTYNTIGNVNIDVPAAQGLLANDLDPNGPPAALTIISPPTTTTGGGTLAINASTGAFTYNPPVNYRAATDTFTYTIGNGTGKTDTATVTINVSGMIWFVNAAAPAGGNGTLANPFNCLVGAGCFDPVAADQAGDSIFLYSGNYTGGLTLLSTQKLIGQGAPTSILAITGFAAPSGNNLLPATNGTDPVITVASGTAITLGQNNELHGFTVGNSSAAGTDIAGTTFGTTPGLTVKDVTLNGNGRALNLMTGTIVSGSTFPTIESTGGSPAEGIRLNTVGGAFTVTTTNIVNPTGIGIDVQNAPAGTNFNFGSTTVNKSGSSGIGVNLTSNSGTFSFSSLTATTTNGFALNTSNSGTVNVTTGSLTQNGAGGGAASLTNTILAMSFTSVSSNGGGNGIIISGGSGTFTTPTTNLQSNAGVGILMTNSAVVANFGNTTVNSSAGDGVDLSSNTGSITFADLDITPDANLRGLDASENSGTITVTSGAISTSGGIAVNITKSSGTTPLAVSLTSVSATGGTNGIKLKGTAGSFSVAGTGTAGSGGTIQNTTGADGSEDGSGVFMNNAASVSLTRMVISNHANYGIRRIGGSGFTLANSTVGGANGSNVAFDECSIGMTNALGTNAITSCDVSGGVEDTMLLTYAAGATGSATFNVTATSFHDNNVTTGNSGVQLFTDPASTAAVTFNFTSNCTFNTNRGDGMLVTFNGTAQHNLTVDTCQFNNNGQAMDVASDFSADFTFSIKNNTLLFHAGAPIALGTGANATAASFVTGSISNNTVGNVATIDSGSSGGRGIILDMRGAEVGQITVHGNTVSHTDFEGLFLDTRIGTGSLQLQVTNNVVNTPDDNSGFPAGFVPGIVVTGRDTRTLCLDMRNNNSANVGAFDIRTRQSNTAVFQLEGFAGNGMLDTSVEAFYVAQNPGNTADVQTGGTGTVVNYTTSAGCTTPAPSAPDEILPASLLTESGNESVNHIVTKLLNDIVISDLSELLNSKANTLTDQEVATIVRAAIARLAEKGLSADDKAFLEKIKFEITDLPDEYLARVTSDMVQIDMNAAGYGWFIDPTPNTDFEFINYIGNHSVQARHNDPLIRQFDLLTVVMREMVFLLGQEKQWPLNSRRGLFTSRILSGVRISPETRNGMFNVHAPQLASFTSPFAPLQLLDVRGESLTNIAAVAVAAPAPVASAPEAPTVVGQASLFGTDSLFPSSVNNGRMIRRVSGTDADLLIPSYAMLVRPNAPAAVYSGETVTKALGTIPPGESVTIMFQVTVANPLPAGVCTVSNQGTVSGSNFSNVLTDDPSVGGAANPTVTTIVKPVVIGACPANITQSTDANLCTAIVNFTTPTADGCPVPTVSCTPAGGSAFPKGVTTVTCTASNAAGTADDSVCTFTVTINDTQAPVFANCTNQTANTAPGVCTAVVTYTTTLNDNCPGQTFTCTPASGSTFVKGVTTVTCTGSDAAGNAATPCSFTVTVNDNQPPVLTCPANVAVNNDPGLCSAVVNFTTPMATDNCPPSPFAASCVPPTGTAFPKGVTTVTCTATDAMSLSAMCTFTVTVSDNEPPKSCVTPPVNMISWWAGDGNASDIQGVAPNNNNGTNNGATFAAGKVAQAFSFNGAGQWVSVPNSSSINLTGTAVTIDGWINPNSNASDAVYFGKSANAANDFVLLYQFSNISAIIKANGTETTINTGVSPTVGVWTHIALVYNGTDMRVYVNGVLSGAPTAKTGNLAGSNVPFGIGGRAGGLFFNGLVDEVELFNRALSAAEILSIFNAQSFGKCKPVVVNNTPGQCSATNTYTNPTFTDNCTGATIVCSPAASSTFPVGTTTVTCTISDTATPTANTLMNSFVVRVVDNQAPTLGACPANQTVNESAPGSGSAIVTYTNPTSTDNCPGQTVSCTPASGSSFPVGTTTVSCKATDASGNMSAPCTFTVTVNPLCSVICPANVTVNNTPNQCGAVVTYPAPTTTGSCGTVTCSPASGSFFPKGVTTVTCTPSVASPPCTFTVTVNDTQPPTITCPANVSIASNVCVTNAYTAPTGADNCPGVTVVCSPPPATCFAVGTTTVTCTATDAVGLTAQCMFTVTIVPCTISCPGNVTQNNDPGQCAAIVTYAAPTTTGTCGTVSCSPASGSSFPKGVTTVTCTTQSGPSCTFTVTVNDNQPPTISCPGNITTDTDAGVCTAVESFTPTVTDNCTGATFVCSPASGFAFPKGVTTVTCTASDTATPTANTAMCSFTVTVNDTTPPVLSCPSNVTQGTDPNQCQAVVNYPNATATDNCTGVGTPSCTPASGTIFPKGVTTVSCTVSDASGNAATPCSFTVTVNDTQAPTLTCPANITLPAAAGQCTAVATFTPTVSDNCAKVGTPSCTPASGSVFPKGTTTVTCTVSDAEGLSANCSFTVTVNDTQNPTISCPANVTITSNVCVTNPYTAPTGADNCPGVTVVCSPPPATCFAVGTTTVTCTATDAVGLTAQCSFTVTIVPCAITCPGNVTVNTTPNQCSAVVTYAAPTTTGNCGTVTCTPASGSSFLKGVTTVSCTTQTGPTCSFTVTVNDTQAPVLTCPASVTQSTDPNQCQAVVNYPNATATDNCTGVGTPSCTPASGTIFPKGVTTVTCTVSDASGNAATPCSFTVTVNDTQAPVISCPANLSTTTTAGQCSKVVNYPNATATDNCPGVGTPSCTPASGSAFQKGTTTVTCTVSDASKNSANCSFTITVTDNQPPTISCAPNQVRATDPNQCQAVVTYPAPTVGDNCPGATALCSPASGSTFPKGVTTVSCTVTDGVGLTASCSFTVTVNDTQAPVITCPVNVVSVTPDGKCQVVNYPAPVASDNCPGVTVVCSPASGSCFPIGTTTVSCTATDASGNTSSCGFTVTTFDICIQDDGNPTTVMLINSLTGDYRFCCNGSVFTGVGKIKKLGTVTTLVHNPVNRRVSARVDKSTFIGTASIQEPPGSSRCTIQDRDIRDNTCLCQ